MRPVVLRLISVLTLGLSGLPSIRRRLRYSLSWCVQGALRLRSRSYPVDQDTIALVFAPHQDDETLGAGGLLILKRLEGMTVRIAYITDGSGSHPGHPTLHPDALATQRQEEACHAMRLLGVEQAGVCFLGIRDGTLAHLTPIAVQELVGKIAAVLQEVQPDEVFLPLGCDGSSEHDATFAFVRQAIERTGRRPRIFEFPIWASWNPLRLFRPLLASRIVWRVDYRDHAALKRQAIAAYGSQTEPIAPWEKPMLSREFLSYFCTGAEYFFER